MSQKHRRGAPTLVWSHSGRRRGQREWRAEEGQVQGPEGGPLESHQALVKDGGLEQGEGAGGSQGLKKNVPHLGSHVMELG